ncbi:hypothetical protein EXIGLDRAFT_830197 [Exidia glandulosa HHB12029]|uniref:DUF6534 domain-containing protein n=1 Tax=Exidia glandulosa HHB12029 TaxID=1314781 RepID=A0A165NUD9_EXIGL|nr:hypothetical protein EXIGLDRAFT_830197 [Exidia glandulosa HHB12029]
MSSLPTGPLTPSPALPGIPVAFPPGVSIELTVGAVTISTWFSVLFCGIVITLGYIYYLEFSEDRLHFKLVAAGAIFLSLVDTVANLVWAHEWTVTLWGSIPGTGITPYAFYVNILVASLSCLLTQCFFAWRLWNISRGNKILVGVIVSGSIMQLAVVMWVFSRWAKRPLFVQLGEVLPTAYIWLIAPIISDLAISSAMFYYLRVKTRSAPTSSKLTFNAIISRTVQANVFSLLSQVLTAILMKANIGLYFFLNDVTITKVYAFSLLVSLGARRSKSSMFSMSEKTSKGETSGGGNQISLSNLHSRQGLGPRQVQGIRVTENISVHGDDEWDSQGDRKTATTFLPV